MTRGTRDLVYDDSAPLPEAVRPFRHRGNYRGAYASMAEVGDIVRSALGLVRGLSPASRAHVARVLHLRGDVWTYVHEDAVHVFGRPGSAADQLLASVRAPVAELPPRSAERPPLTLVASPPVDLSDAAGRSEQESADPRPGSIRLVQPPDREGPA